MPLLWAILRIPLAIFVTTLAGLAAALLGDGAWHGLSWLLLAVPVAIIVIAMTRKPDASRRSE
jgi:hypothetical protein